MLCHTSGAPIDVMPDMSTSAFIPSLKRFCARRGVPRKFISDNGKAFKAAAKVIETVVNHQDVQQYLSRTGVEWCFNLEKAPWWGGIFERMIKSTKRCLRQMIGQAKFSYDELLTAVTEVEAIINSRSLSYVSADDLEEPLTPSHLLVGRRILSLPDNLSYQEELDDDDFEVTPNYLSKRVRHLNNVVNHFWKRWRREYLLELRESHRCNQGSHVVTPIENGDVLVHDEGHPRGFWKLAKVERAVVGRDGRIRGAIVRLPTKSGRTTMLQRPLQLLYPLEIKCQANNASDDAAGADGKDAPQLEQSEESSLSQEFTVNAAATGCSSSSKSANEGLGT